MNEQGRQLGAFLFCALSVPAMMLLPSLHPALVVAATMAACWLWQMPGQKNNAAIVAWGMALTAVLCLGAVVRWAQSAYPSAKNAWTLGLILLAMAAYASRGGLQPLLRTGAICFFFLVALDATVLAFGLGNITTVRLAVWHKPDSSVLHFVWLLLPLAAYQLGTPQPSGRWRAAWAAICIVPCLVCWLSLSGAVVSGSEFPFYTLTKSISVIGVMERFEVLLSAALTAGIFCLMGIFTHICGDTLEKRVPKAGKSAYALTFALGAAASLLPKAWLQAAVAGLAAIFWGIVPIATQSGGSRKKDEKNEKKC